MRSSDEVLFSFFLLLALVLCSQLCSAEDTLKAGQKITVNSKKRLVSSNGTFELGFFSLNGSSSDVKSYLGIWYGVSKSQTVVWVANRDNPVSDSSGVFRIAEDGNLVVEVASKRHWSSIIEASSSTNRTLKLLESGNLVLMDDNPGRSDYLWQSFQHPTDTFLPGMKMDASLALTSWRNATDPAPGNFTFKLAQVDRRRSFVVQKQSQIYWDLDELDRDVSPEVHNLLYNTNTNTRGNWLHNISDKTNNKKSRLLMNSSGELQFLKLDDDEGQWEMHWLWPVDTCDIHDHCGSFGICNRNNYFRCKCLPGFAPSHDQSEGELQVQRCERKSTSCINTDVTFLNLTNIKVGSPDQEYSTETEAECQSLCISMCADLQCQAYSYNASTYDRSSSSCNIWTRNLSSLVEEYDRGRDLSILVERSDIAPTPKTCEPCGTYVIPYPLSTGPNCGDPMYNLHCNKSTGHVTFTMPGGLPYPVSWIDEDTRTFSSKMDASHSCSSRRDQNNTPKFPFNVTSCSQDVGIVEFSWQPAPEPPCITPMACMNWPHSTCRENEGVPRCLCDSKYRWNNSIMSCTQEAPVGKHLTHRLALILTVMLGCMAILACITAFVLVRRKRKAHRLDRASTQIQESLYESEKHVKGLIGLGSLEEKDIEGIEVPCYTFASIQAATDNFNDSNKLGRGGYGPVYKGTFPGGQDIAIKRLSSVSTQGLDEFKNEVILISKLQHRNLVRLGLLH